MEIVERTFQGGCCPVSPASSLATKIKQRFGACQRQICSYPICFSAFIVPTQLQSKTQEQQKTGVTKNLKTSFKCYHRNSLYKRLYNDLSFGEKDNLAFSPYLQQSRKQMLCQGRRKPFILPFTQQMFSAISFVRDIILYCSRDTVSPQSNIPFV